MYVGLDCFWFRSKTEIELDKVVFVLLLGSLAMVGFIARAMLGKILIAATYGFTVPHHLHNPLMHPLLFAPKILENAAISFYCVDYQQLNLCHLMFLWNLIPVIKVTIFKLYCLY